MIFSIISVKMLFKVCYPYIVISLFQANDGKNLSTKFSANEQNLILEACFYSVMLPWQRHTNTTLTIKIR